MRTPQVPQLVEGRLHPGQVLGEVLEQRAMRRRHGDGQVLPNGRPNVLAALRQAPHGVLFEGASRQFVGPGTVPRDQSAGRHGTVPHPPR
jgi:hypothetical protein